MEYRIGGGCYFGRHASPSRVCSDRRRPCPCPRGMRQRRKQRCPRRRSPGRRFPARRHPPRQPRSRQPRSRRRLRHRWPPRSTLARTTDPMERTAAAGLPPGPKEYLTNHVHAHLDVFVDGVPVRIPAGIGIDTADPDVKRFDVPDGSFAYGGIEMCSEPCISPLHTHDGSGILHTNRGTSSRTPSASSSPNGAWPSATPASGSSAARRRSPSMSTASPSPGPASDRADRPPGDRDRDRHPPAVIPATADFSQA